LRTLPGWFSNKNNILLYKMSLSAKEFIKKMTTVPEGFVDEMFDFYDMSTLQTDFVIRLDVLTKWLHTRKDKLVETLQRSYKANIDYTIIKVSPQQTKPHANNVKLYLLTPDCFKRLALLSRSKNAEMVRTYFIEVESLFIKYREQTLEGMKHDIERLERNQKPKGNFDPRRGYLYIIRASDDEGDSVFKIGRNSKDLLGRLRQYNTGRADSVEVLYTYQTDDVVGAEGCLKAFLKKYQYRKYKEVYQANIDMIKAIISSCDETAKYTRVYSNARADKLMTGGYYMVLERDIA